MDWGKLLQIALSVIEKNPQLLEDLITALLNLFVSKPALLSKAVEAGIAQLEKTYPAPPPAPPLA